MADDTGARSTRQQVMSLLLTRGPIAASDIGEALGLSAAGVRRHLDKLVDDALAETCQPRAVAGEEASRGRPAKHYRLTERGREQFGSQYEALASDAIETLKEVGGSEAVKALARAWTARVLSGVEGVEGVDQSGSDAAGSDAAGSDAAGSDAAGSDRAVEEVARQLAAAFDANGYAATVRRAGSGVQICQHHCPVSAVAAEHPEICVAEHEAISALVGRHIQPLALIADGDGICTTNIPLAAATRTARPAPQDTSERSGDCD